LSSTKQPSFCPFTYIVVIKTRRSRQKIYFKTDDDGLFESSLTYFKESGFEIEKITYDLHKEDIFEGKNIETEHEKMFSEQGIKIKALIGKKNLIIN